MSSLSSQPMCRGPPVSRSDSVGSNRGPASLRGSEEGQSEASMAPKPRLGLGQLSEQQRGHIFTEVLNEQRAFLCAHLDPIRHIPYLKSKRCFERSNEERIKHCVTTVEKVDCFIDELIRAGPNAMTALLESLERTRVEQYTLTTLLDALFAYPTDDLNLTGEADRSAADRYRYDIDDERSSVVSNRLSSNRLSGQLSSMSFQTDTTSGDPSDAVFPPLDYQQLRDAEGARHQRDSDCRSYQEPVEVSDISTQGSSLVSHGNTD